MDVDDILAKQVEQLEKEKKEMQEKLKGQEKKVNLLYFVTTWRSIHHICPLYFNNFTLNVPW